MTDEVLEIADDGAVLLRVLVAPGAGRSAVVGRHGDALKVRVAAAPEKGRANEACRALLAESLGVAESQIELLSGATSRAKRFAVRGLEAEEARRTLDRLIAGPDEPAPVRRRDRDRR